MTSSGQRFEDLKINCADTGGLAYPGRIRTLLIADTDICFLQSVTWAELVGVNTPFAPQCKTWAPNYRWFHAAQNSPILTGAIDAAMGGRGEAVLVTGEAGVGKTRLLVEARRVADRREVLVLRGRAVESGGVYRPLVDAFARASAPFADDPALARLRPTVARVLPGWVVDNQVPAPMADPAAVFAEALIALLWVMAPDEGRLDHG